MSGRNTSRNDLLIFALLAAAVLAVFAQSGHFAFINYDDPDYVTSNFHVRAGLTAASIRWALTSGYASNWFPLTWLSHMADYQFFGLQSGLHHWTSLLIHLLSTLLLYFTLRRMTGAIWPSAFTAFIFGAHPLHVESVVWISERKDVLCAFFWILTLCNYARYTERPNWQRYTITLITFSLGLLSKPMIVTLPFVLLLLDYWPLRRFANKQRVIYEKLPLLALSAIASVVTYVVQRNGGAVISLREIPLNLRIANAILSYATYLFQAIVPLKLSPFYPFTDPFPIWQAGAAALLLIGISILVFRNSRQRPYLATGWLWYLGALAPVIGLVQAGNQAHADRYTYIPLIGASIMLAWGAAEMLERRPNFKPALLAATCALCIACAGEAWRQAGYWKNSATLFTRALAVTGKNYVAWKGLAEAQKDGNDLEAAAHSYRNAIAARPQDPDAHNNLGEILLNRGCTADAVAQFEEALRLNPDVPEAHTNLGAAFTRLGKDDEAAAQFKEALRLQPESAAAHTGAGAILEDEGRESEASAELLQAIRLNPDYAPAHYNLGLLLGKSGHPTEAAQQFAEAVRLQPDNAENHFNFGIALAAQGNLPEATAAFQTAVRLDPNYAAAHFNLGTAYAESGHINEAIGEFSEALRLRPDFTAARESLANAMALRSRDAAN